MAKKIKKKPSRLFSRGRSTEEEPPTSSTSNVVNQEETEQPRRSSATDLYETFVKIEEDQDLGEPAEPTEPDRTKYQPFPRSESPWTVGRHGLYCLSEADELPPRLPPATPGVEYGKTRPFVVPDNMFLQPGNVVDLIDMLREPAPELPKPRTMKETFGWKKQQVKALIKNPKADPKFAMLPRGMNNRIKQDKIPRQDQMQHAIESAPKTPQEPEDLATFAETTKASLPIQPMPLISNHVPRYCPKVRPTKHLDPGPARDEWGNAFGGEHEAFHETREERAKRIAVSDKYRDHRKASDRYLGVQGQKHVNNPVIGRPPPISNQKLFQPLRLTESAVERANEEKEAALKAKEAKPSPKVRFASEPEVIIVNYAFQSKPVAATPSLTIPAPTPPLFRRTLPPSTVELLPLIASASASASASAPASAPGCSQSLSSPEPSTPTALVASALRNVQSFDTVEPSPTGSEKHDDTNPPLPIKGDRYFKWDQAMLASKKPVAILPTKQEPKNPPPPIPGSLGVLRTGSFVFPARSQTPLAELDTINPLNISGALSQPKYSKSLLPERKIKIGIKEPSSDPKDSSGLESNLPDNLPAENEQRDSEVRRILAKNSEVFARQRRDEVEDVEGEALRYPQTDEPPPILKPQGAGSGSPFDDADDERRRIWEDAAKTLAGRGARMRETFDFEKLAKVLPHLAQIQDFNNESIILGQVSGDEENVGQATPTNAYRTLDHSEQSQNQPTDRQYNTDASHRRSRPDQIDVPYQLPPWRAEDHQRLYRPPWINDEPVKPTSRSASRNSSRRNPHVDDDEKNEEPDNPRSKPGLTRKQGEYLDSRGPTGSSSGFRMPEYGQSHVERAQATPSATGYSAAAPRIPIQHAHATPLYDNRLYDQTQIFSPLNRNQQPQRPLPPLPAPTAPLQLPPRRRPPPTSFDQFDLPPPPKSPKKKTWKPSFLDSCLTVSGAHLAKMDSKLQVRPAEFSSVKAKAVEDARQMQATVIEVASKSGKVPPKYALLELIGKGSFGRVYKGKDMTSAAIVAVKIIDIDESDTLNPRLADSYSEFLKEVNALKILSESNARNINHVIEALPVGQAMWMITEYCGGGSIATLMKPTAPGGLQEKWIIPILREVAEAIKWVHQAGIIHRDIKCANVLITEEGGVQLCDFGVAGIIENKLDKRSTVIGTPHWMAPELFDATPSYGKEVDIWAFGSMVYEIATGLPPNVANLISVERLGSYLKNNVPRLEGGSYSNDLRNLVAYCLEELPSSRPTIEQVQKHPFIYNTGSRYPASSLSYLVRAFKMWEDHGGSRKSLFMLGGAQGPTESSLSIVDDEWNFSTTAAFDQEVSRQSTPQDVFEAYGQGVALEGFFSEETSRPQPQKPSRRRPPPEALARLPAPLEKIFDPNTLSNYEDNSRNHYGRAIQLPTSDLPLRDDTAQTSIRDTMIDLGGHDSDTGLSNFPDMDTIKANRRGIKEESEDEYISTIHDFSRPALSDPADTNANRRTQDWKFPTMAPPASADPELSRFPTSYDLPRPSVTPGSGARPALVHHPTEPIGASFGGSLLDVQQATMGRLPMRESLIDLDMSMPDVLPSYARPSTANSDAGSTISEQMTSGNPFEFERHASSYAPLSSESTDITEPEYYITEEPIMPLVHHRSNSAVRDIGEISDFSASEAESSQDPSANGKYETSYSDSDMPPPSLPDQVPFPRPTNQPYTFAHFPELPAPPSERALSGHATPQEMKDEFNRMLTSMTSGLESFRDVYSSPQIVQRKGSMPQRRKDGGAAVNSGRT